MGALRNLDRRHAVRFGAGIVSVAAAIYASAHAAALAGFLHVSADLVGDVRSFLFGTGATLLFLSFAGAVEATADYLGNLTHVYPAWRSSMHAFVNEFHDDANSIDYGAQLQTSKSCIIVLNDGFTWTKRNWQHLVRRVNDGLAVTFVICHPDSALLDYIAEKSNKGDDEQKKDVLQCIAAVRRLATINRKARVEIVGSRLVNCYAGFVFDDKIYISPYHTRFRQDRLPAIELRRPQGGQATAFAMLKADVLEHIRHCRSGIDFDLRQYPAQGLPEVDLSLPGES